MEEESRDEERELSDRDLRDCWADRGDGGSQGRAEEYGTGGIVGLADELEPELGDELQGEESSVLEEELNMEV